MIRIKAYILIVLVLALFGLSFNAQAKDKTEAYREYQIKAAFLYNFIKFVDWPKEKPVESNDIITIGIVGSNPFGEAFKAAKDEKIKDKKLVVKQFPGLEEYKTGAKDKAKYKEQYANEYRDALKRCHIVFISSSEEKHLSEIINLVRGSNVLTVGETETFLDGGGIINFITEKKKVRFEINLVAAKQDELQIRSQLLRLAKRVIE